MFLKYRELNISLIPLRFGQKRPVENGWEKYCDRLPTFEEASVWEKGQFSFGVALGSASNLTALDIDSDDIAILNACKSSPVRKRGKKGETRFFKYSSSVSSTKIAGCIDVLARGRQTVVPPSIHPDTGLSYVWTSPATLENFDLNSLPELTINDVSEMRRVLEPASPFADKPLQFSDWRNSASGQLPEGSRNNSFASIIGGLLRCGIHPRDAHEYARFLNQAKCRPPLSPHELEKIFASIVKKEFKRRIGYQR